MVTIIYRVPIITEWQRVEEEGLVRGFVLLDKNIATQGLCKFFTLWEPIAITVYHLPSETYNKVSEISQLFTEST